MPLLRLLAVSTLCLVVLATRAHAIKLNEIPDDLRRRLPEFVLAIIPPESMAYLTLADLEEYAEAYETGVMHFVAEVRVEEAKGPLTPELAALVLQVPQGAPFIEQRFERLAQRAYGQNIFTSLSWAIHPNADGSVDVQLWYASGDPQAWIPDIGYSSQVGWLYGVQYQDLYYNNESKQLTYGVQLSENDPQEPRLHASWSDGTLDGGNAGYGLSASVYSDWRTRRGGTTHGAELRQRIATVSGSYTKTLERSTNIGGRSVSYGAGILSQESNVTAVAADFGSGPREDLEQAGTTVYASVSTGDRDVDSSFMPRRGASWSVGAQQYFGDFTFSRVSADGRWYKPVRNLLGIEAECFDASGNRQDVRRTLPGASIAVQVQAVLAEGDVPFSLETRSGSNIARGYAYDRYVGTKMLGLRGEYRLALTESRGNDGYVFVDSALIGEELGELESLASYGVGGTFKLPLFGVSAGLFYGRSFDGAEAGYGFSVGYQF